jgi:hypothetical protein
VVLVDIIGLAIGFGAAHEDRIIDKIISRRNAAIPWRILGALV